MVLPSLAGKQLCSVYAKQSCLESDKAAAFALFGDGRQQRDFTFVQDVVEA